MSGKHALVFSILVSALAVTWAMPSGAAAAPGDLDPSFSADGIVTSNLGEARGEDVAIQPDGKAVVVGRTESCTEVGKEFLCESEFLIERYDTNGTLDTSFGGGDGIVTTDFGGEFQDASSVLIEPSGKLLVAGTVSHQSGFQEVSTFALARYEEDGTLDPGFGGGDGKATTAFSGVEGPQTMSGSLVRLPSGKIVLGGEVFVHEAGESVNWHMALARYESDGSLDTSFGTGGTTVGPKGHLFGLAEEPGGKLLAVGRSNGEADFALARFNADGSLDTGFAGGGIATLHLSPSGSQADDVAVQPDGKIVAAGFGDFAPAIARFDADGALDTTFGGGDGVVEPEFGRPCCTLGAAIALALQTDGRIVLAGQWVPDAETFESSFDDEWAVGRLDADGAPDASFGTDGLTTTDVEGGGFENWAEGVAIQSDGKIVAVGGTGEPDEDLALARYEGGGSTPPPTLHQVLVGRAGSGSGAVFGPELDCGLNCGADYPAGETIELEAFAEPGSTFSGWSTSGGNPGTCTGATNPCEVTLAANVGLVATFAGPGKGDGSEGDGNAPSPSVTNSSPQPSEKAKLKPKHKALHCRRGFKKKRVRGKPRCVRAGKRHTH